MKILTCPLNGPRNIAEFVYGGEARPEPDRDAGDALWVAHLYSPENRPHITVEWWCHAPTNTWFMAERHLRTDEILRTYLPGAQP